MPITIFAERGYNLSAIKEIIVPPSGFSKEQVVLLSNFFRSISTAFTDEGHEIGANPKAMLNLELSKIEELLQVPDSNNVGQEILKALKSFYETIIHDEPSTYEDYHLRSERAVKDIETYLLSIKIPD